MNNIIFKKDKDWHHQLGFEMKELKIECHFFFDGSFRLLSLANDRLVIHLVNVENCFQPVDLINLQGKFAQTGIILIHIWEDIWLTRPTQTTARIKSLLGLNTTIHGRKTKANKISKPVADEFLNENHLQGAVNSRHKLGLFEGSQLVAVATFSALRKMNHTNHYKSAELIRFAVKAGFSVTGGLSKLIAHFASLQNPDDLMTYADRDWSTGAAYKTLGFVQTGLLEPKQFVLNTHWQRTLKKSNSNGIADLTVFNTGSLKFILKF